ncbi:hypothetical protein FD754_011648 [Muntiacus muntjak]|uniref:Calcineurin-like phosphoesterase domain-containing protein n=1 Tax=Muntiacus muntjak TaxID=9888 RepID=A0A5N3VC61_MUNMU|nr:hypothetical protein FD754_011648 [Muntiacus muntjak]
MMTLESQGECKSTGVGCHAFLQGIFPTQGSNLCRPWRKEQTEDLQRVLRTVDSDIPLVLVSGNHDVGNVPTPETIAEFQRTWGDDYFSFWVGGVLFLVLNSQFLYDASRCPALKQEHDRWLEQQLRTAGQRACRHAVVFQHIPLFLQSIGEDDDYFNLTKSVRKEMADKFVEAANHTRDMYPCACTHTQNEDALPPEISSSDGPSASPAHTAHFSSWEPLQFSSPEKWLTWQDSSCDNCCVSCFGSNASFQILPRVYVIKFF